MKRETTRHGAASSVKQMKKDWEECWAKLSQEKVQGWIEAIPLHIQRIIECEGGNEYREGTGRSGRNRNPNRVH